MSSNELSQHFQSYDPGELLGPGDTIFLLTKQCHQYAANSRQVSRVN